MKWYTLQKNVQYFIRIILSNIVRLVLHVLLNRLFYKIQRWSGRASLFIDFFGFIYLFNHMSTFVGYLMPKPFFYKNCSGTI